MALIQSGMLAKILAASSDYAALTEKPMNALLLPAIQ
jgi:hypothetical protein